MNCVELFQILNNKMNVTVQYQNNIITKHIPVKTTLSQLFNIFADDLNLSKLQTTQFIIYINQNAYSFNEIPLISLGYTSDKTCVILKIEDFLSLDTFFHQYLHTLLYTVYQLAEEQKKMIKGFASSRKLILHHQNPDVQAHIMSVIPYELLDNLNEVQQLYTITAWFKNDFFKWARSIPCHICGGPTEKQEDSKPTPQEMIGDPSRTEQWLCSSCNAITRFPRYNNVIKLLETRFGRCGEWANTFHAILKVLGYDVRYIRDWTDHVWVEVWIESEKRYIHIDPCENIIDAPLTYEKGWGKKLTWIVAFNDHECVDVTKRYTEKKEEVLQRRGSKIPEKWFEELINLKNLTWRENADDPKEVGRRQLMDRLRLEKRGKLKPEEQCPRKSICTN